MRKKLVMPERSIPWRRGFSQSRSARRRKPCLTRWTRRRLIASTVTFGESRDSDDAEGAVTGTSDKRPSRDEIEAAIPQLVGAISQIPPIYSAIKVDGERAYDLARDGEEVVLEPRTVLIHSVRFLGMADADHAEFEMVCGKGTYVRAWARDLAFSLGTLAYVSQLRRLSIGNFNVELAIGLEPLKGFMHSPAAFEYLRPISTALDGIPALAVTGQDVVRLKSGNPILVRPREFERIAERAGGDDLQGLTVFLSTGDGEPVALASFAEGELRPFRVFNFATG